MDEKRKSKIMRAISQFIKTEVDIEQLQEGNI